MIEAILKLKGHKELVVCAVNWIELEGIANHNVAKKIIVLTDGVDVYVKSNNGQWIIRDVERG